MEPDLASFVEWLSSRGAVERASPSTLLVSSFDGILLDPPVRIEVTAESLDRLLDATGDSAAGLWPDAPPRVGASRLLTIHVEELLTVQSRATSLVLDAPALRAERLDAAPVDLPAGEYRWEMRSGQTFDGDPS